MLVRLILCLFLLVMANNSFSTRIKDITSVAGVRENQLVGYGLVVGLDGTGDRTNQTPFTQQTFRNMLLQFGIRIPPGLNYELKNIAAVAVSASLPPFAKVGQKMDVTVSSLGNASSLRGGQLLMTPLKGADDQVYAMAQGSVVVSGFGAQGSDGSKVTVNVVSTGRIPNGATVENSVSISFVKNGTVTFELNQPDFTTAQAVANLINRKFSRKIAETVDATAIDVHLGNLVLKPAKRYLTMDWKDEAEDYDRAVNTERQGDFVSYISKIENLVVDTPQTRARIVVNSRTGTIVVDQNVMIAPVAVAHGNLSVVVSERPFVSQPQALSNGSTVTGTASDINVNQSPSRAFLFKSGASLNELVDQVNRVGAAPGDLIAILEAIKAAGAMQAEIEVI